MSNQTEVSRFRFAFISSNRAWGGSEELWSAAAASVAEAGHDVTVYKSRINTLEPRVKRLRETGVRIRDLAKIPFMPRQFFGLIGRMSSVLMYAHEMGLLVLGLFFSRRPDLVVISQGGNHDGHLIGEICRRMGLPYVLLQQKAADLYWPADFRRKRLAGVYSTAIAAYFVSDHNRRLTEEQLGLSLPRASVVRNPFAVQWTPRTDWPDEANGIRFACVGRMYPMEKGQDLLLRVLARPHWRQRPVSVTFYGTGLQSEGLEGMARHLGLTNVSFRGFVRDVEAIWSEHHALVLPSRCEGLPLVVVEAMMSGRIAIVTDVGGSGEVVTNGETGYLAAAPSEDALDEAMERAWNERSRWRAIAATAAARIRTLVTEDPGQTFAETLIAVAASRQPAEAYESSSSEACSSCSPTV